MERSSPVNCSRWFARNWRIGMFLTQRAIRSQMNNMRGATAPFCQESALLRGFTWFCGMRSCNTQVHSAIWLFSFSPTFGIHVDKRGKLAQQNWTLQIEGTDFAWDLSRGSWGAIKEDEKSADPNGTQRNHWWLCLCRKKIARGNDKWEKSRNKLMQKADGLHELLQHDGYFVVLPRDD